MGPHRMAHPICIRVVLTGSGNETRSVKPIHRNAL